jgi:hypothetical protein
LLSSVIVSESLDNKGNELDFLNKNKHYINKFYIYDVNLYEYLKRYI